MWIAQVWAIGRSYMKLGPTIAMLSHGIFVKLIGFTCVLFTVLHFV